jgi:hypothetical protein
MSHRDTYGPHPVILKEYREAVPIGFTSCPLLVPIMMTLGCAVNPYVILYVILMVT